MFKKFYDPLLFDIKLSTAYIPLAGGIAFGNFGGGAYFSPYFCGLRLNCGLHFERGLPMNNKRKFKHLTWTDRLIIEKDLKLKMSAKQIAEHIGCSIRTVYYEIKRGECIQKEYRYTDYWGERHYKEVKAYSPDIAEEKYRQELSAKGAPLKLSNDYKLADYIERRIVDDGLTPGAVLGEIKRNNLSFKTEIKSVHTIYNYIDKNVFLRLSLKNLPIKSKRKKHKRKIQASKAPQGTSIEKRPKEILQRNTFGHWEMDCVVGTTLKTLLILTERLTRKEIIIPIPNKKAVSVVNALNKLERKFGKLFKKIFKTITVDNGVEFSDFDGIEKSIYGKNKKRTTVYYCHPYSSYERGTNERLNREIRRKLPKGTNFNKVSDKEIKAVEDWVNNYPKAVLGYATANEVFEKYVSALI